VDGAPPGFGARPELRRHDVIFLVPPLRAAEALARVPANPQVDRVVAGRGVLYVSRVAALASRSRVSRVVALPIYRRMTIRSWNTTVALLALLEGRAAR
jgi:uncharacterized protein (DUF1697 family)